jgi:hypothetical protein
VRFVNDDYIYYYLQHNLYSQQGWLKSRRLLDHSIREGASPAEVRQQEGPRLQSGKRSWRVTGGPTPNGEKLAGVEALAFVPAQFSTNRRFVFSDHCCNLRSVMSHFQQRVYLVSLFSGKLCVVHKRSFDLAVFRGLSYTSLPLSTIKVALVT